MHPRLEGVAVDHAQHLGGMSAANEFRGFGRGRRGWGRSGRRVGPHLPADVGSDHDPEEKSERKRHGRQRNAEAAGTGKRMTLGMSEHSPTVGDSSYTCNTIYN